MILIDLGYPEKCMNCKLYKCGGCIPMDNKKVPDDIWDQGKPDWCPIIADICKSLSNSINHSLLYGINNEIEDRILKNFDKVKPNQGADDSKDRYRYMQWMSCRENIIEYFKKIKEENKEFERSITKVGILDDNFWRTLELKHPLKDYQSESEDKYVSREID